MRRLLTIRDDGLMHPFPPEPDDRAEAILLEANPLEEGVLTGETLVSHPATPVVWTGSLAGPLFARDPRTWSPAGWAALGAWCDAVRDVLEHAARTVMLRPHARHVLSDVQRCVRFFEDRAGQPFTLALEPAAMLEPTMLAGAEDHLGRIFEFLAPRAAVVIMSNVAPLSDGAETPLQRGRAHHGAIDPALTARLVREHVPEATPIALFAGDEAAQIEALGLDD